MTNLQPATPNTNHSTMAAAGQYLTFGLKGETYAINLLSVKEIISYDQPTAVPMMPNFICGVINIRGKVVPVVDLLARFGQGSTLYAKRTSIIIVETVDHFSEVLGRENASDNINDIGVIVDAVHEVIDITETTIEPAPNFGTGIRSDFIVGMAKRDERFIVMLAVDRVLALDEMASLGQAMVQH